MKNGEFASAILRLTFFILTKKIIFILRFSFFIFYYLCRLKPWSFIEVDRYV